LPLGAAAVCALSLSCAACSSTTILVRPDELPRITASREHRVPRVVVASDGQPVALGGYLDEVRIARKNGGRDYFFAPVESRIEDQALIVQGRRFKERYPLAEIASVKVSASDKYENWRTAGLVLTPLGVAVSGIGVGLSIGYPPKGGFDSIPFLFFSLPALIVGSAFLSAGIPCLVFGYREPAADRVSGAPRSLLRPSIVAAPGGAGLGWSF
jgi:hypothetical protein